MPSEMIGKGPEQKKPVTSAEALDILEERKKDGELGYEQKLAYEHMGKFNKLSIGEAKKMMKELAEYGVGETVAIKICDIMPIDVVQLKQILVKAKKSFEEDEIGKIMGVVQAHSAK